MNLSEAIAELEELKPRIDALMAGVKPGIDAGSYVEAVEQGHAALLRAFIGALLIAAPGLEFGLVWPLVENSVPDHLLNHPDIQREKGYLSSPLEGTPTEVLMRIKILNEKSAWYEANRIVRSHLNSDQRYIMRLLDESLML
jgi:hypothetical protein